MKLASLIFPFRWPIMSTRHHQDCNIDVLSHGLAWTRCLCAALGRLRKAVHVELLTVVGVELAELDRPEGTPTSKVGGSNDSKLYEHLSSEQSTAIHPVRGKCLATSCYRGVLGAIIVHIRSGMIQICTSICHPRRVQQSTHCVPRRRSAHRL